MKAALHHITQAGDDEISNVSVDKAMLLLRLAFPGVDGLQAVGLGQCTQRSLHADGSLPRFPAVERPFVQVLNIGDHWICVTNVFSCDTNEIYLYDSLYHGTVSNDTVLQLSSLLRQNDDCDDLTIHVRNFDIQPNRTRLCGFLRGCRSTVNL